MMDALLLGLIRSGGPITTAELLKELRVLQRTGSVELAEAEVTLSGRGQVDSTPAGVWRACYPRVETAPAERQRVLF